MLPGERSVYEVATEKRSRFGSRRNRNIAIVALVVIFAIVAVLAIAALVHATIRPSRQK